MLALVLILSVYTYVSTAILPPSYQNITLLTEEFKRAKPLIQNLISTGKVRGPIVVRLAWHDAGTYCKYCNRMGGPHAVLRYPSQEDDPADNGLYTAVEPLYTIYNGTKEVKGFNETLTLSDFWQFAAVVAIEQMGGPHIPYKPGREDWDQDQMTPYDRLPDGAFGFPNFEPTGQYVRDIFYRMGFNDTEIVVLIGGHTLGECHQEWSGFFGPWTPDPNSFDNDFYQELISDTWKVTPNTQQYYDTSDTTLMMLHTDMVLVNDPIFLKEVKKYAADQQAWFHDFTQIFPKLQENGVTTLLSPINW